MSITHVGFSAVDYQSWDCWEIHQDLWLVLRVLWNVAHTQEANKSVNLIKFITLTASAISLVSLFALGAVAQPPNPGWQRFSSNSTRRQSSTASSLTKLVG